MVISGKRARGLLSMNEFTWVCLKCFMYSQLPEKIEPWTPPRHCPVCDRDMVSKAIIGQMIKEKRLEVLVPTGLFFAWPRFEPFALDPEPSA